MALRILDTSDLDVIRATAMPLVRPDKAARLVPNSLLVGPNFAGRVEMIIIKRIGIDWPKILAGNAPIAYANGDPGFAQQLLKDAAIMMTCSFLCPVLKQLIPINEQSEVITLKRDLNWNDLAAQYMEQAQQALNLLKPLVGIIPGMQAGKKAPEPSDPDSPQSVGTIRPIYTQRIRPQGSIP
jgi:hypothetical protein